MQFDLFLLNKVLFFKLLLDGVDQNHADVIILNTLDLAFGVFMTSKASTSATI
jgi:hypothetical protein